VALAACGIDGRSASNQEPEPIPAAKAVTARPEGWSKPTHSRKAHPNYDAAFPQDRVARMTIRIAPERWAAMLADMERLHGPRGPVDPNAPSPTPGVVRRDPDGVIGVPNPMWAPATVEFEGNTWTSVGMRFKGTSSLYGGWTGGSDRLPLKLDFDQFEDDVPAIRNQRFHGFKQLSLATNWGDPTHIRESLAHALLGTAGLVASRTALYEVVLDRGEGEASLGLYTAVEVTDDTVLKRSFADPSGTIYDAEGSGASFAPGARGGIRTSFQRDGGPDVERSDLFALHDHLHAPGRLTDPAAWRGGLEALFDVPAFLTWLGMAASLEHWDSYGQRPQNYYLYNDPATGRFTFISWDHNYTWGAGKGGGGGGVPSFDKSGVSGDWPLISYILAQPEYAAFYHESLRGIAESVFIPSAIEERIDGLEQMIVPYVDRAEFEAAVAMLRSRIDSRAAAMAAYLAT
jgi:hypothetical protein